MIFQLLDKYLIPYILLFILVWRKLRGSRSWLLLISPSIVVLIGWSTRRWWAHIWVYILAVVVIPVGGWWAIIGDIIAIVGTLKLFLKWMLEIVIFVLFLFLLIFFLLLLLLLLFAEPLSLFLILVMRHL